MQNNNKCNIKESVILNTGSTFSSVKDKNVITGVRKAKKPIETMTNVGTQIIGQEDMVSQMKNIFL